MPMKPHEGEERDAFVARCMSEEKDAIPDQEQRLAACFSMWRKAHGEAEPESKSDAVKEMQSKIVDLLTHKGKDQGFHIKAASREAEILLYGEVGDDLFGGVSAKTFADELKKAGKLERITMRLNSPGGSVFDGLAIYNTLQNHPAHVTMHIDGLAASAASVVAMAGQKIYAAENAIMMVHDPWALVIGSAEEMRAMAVSLDKVAEGMAKTYARRSGKSIEQAKEWMGDETWFSAEEAKAVGLIDEVAVPMKVAASWDVMAWRKRYRHPPEHALLVEPKPTGKPLSAFDERFAHVRMRLERFNRQAG